MPPQGVSMHPTHMLHLLALELQACRGVDLHVSGAHRHLLPHVIVRISTQGIDAACVAATW